MEEVPRAHPISGTGAPPISSASPNVSGPPFISARALSADRSDANAAAEEPSVFSPAHLPALGSVDLGPRYFRLEPTVEATEYTTAGVVKAILEAQNRSPA